MISRGSFSFWTTRRTTGDTCPSCGTASLTTEEAVARVGGELAYVTLTSCGACGASGPPS